MQSGNGTGPLRLAEEPSPQLPRSHKFSYGVLVLAPLYQMIPFSRKSYQRRSRFRSARSSEAC